MIEQLLKFTIRKPILNHILLVFLFVLSILAYKNVAKELFPPSSLNAISISGSYLGASSKTLDNIAVSLLEDEVKNISGVDSIKSTVKNNTFSLNISLQQGVDQNKALNEVKDIVSSLKKDFPSDMDEPTVKIVVKIFPLVNIAVASNDKTTSELIEISKELKSDIFSLSDISTVFIRGDRDFILDIKLDEDKIKSYDVSLNQVINAIKSISTILPIGSIEQSGANYFVSTMSKEGNLEEFKDTTLILGNKSLKIRDIADIKHKLEDANILSHFNATNNISITINKSKSGDAIALVKKIKKILITYETKYEDTNFQIFSDTSIWIRNRLNTVTSNIVFGLILVIATIFFWVNGRIAFVVGVGIPVSFMIGLIALNHLGYSLNMLSLLGALMALGMLVDEAIVVAENIYRHMQEGKSKKDAVIDGTKEVFPAVLTATATTIFAFLPLLIMSGELGIFMKIIPVMITILLLSSLFEAFFFLPLHAYDTFKVDMKHKGTNTWNKLRDMYKKTLRVFLKYKHTSLLLFLIINLGGTYLLFKNSKFQLFPDFDSTRIYISGTANKNFSLKETASLVLKIEKKILKNIDNDNVKSITSLIGLKLDAKNRSLFAKNNFHIFVTLNERSPDNLFDKYINPYLSPVYDDSGMKRVLHSQIISENLNKLLINEKNDIQNFEEFNVIVPQAGIVESDIAISFSGKDKDVSSAIDVIQTKLRLIKGVSNLRDDALLGASELKLKLNQYGESLGFNEVNLANTLRNLFFDLSVSKVIFNDELIDVKLSIKNKDSLETLKNVTLKANDGSNISLQDIVTFIYRPSLAAIYKEDAKAIQTIYGSIDKKIISSAEIIKQIEPLLEEIKQNGVNVEVKGEKAENDKVKKEMGEAAIIAILLIFIALVWMFDSLTLPFMVIANIPLSLFGVMLGHLVMGMNLTMPGMLGVVGLSGVIVNDGILILEFIKKSKNIEDVLNGADTRLRAILLTSITTILGLSSLIFFASGQALILQPMAISLGFGILWGTMLNLLFLPLLFSVVRRIK